MQKPYYQIISLLAIVAIFFILSINFLPSLAFAVNAEDYVPPTDGLVNCGKGDFGPMDCTLTKLLELINSVLNFFMYAIVFPVSIMLIIYAGGSMAYYAGWKPGESARAKKILIDVLIGFAIIFSAFVVVHQVFGFFLGNKADGPVKQAIEAVFGSD